MNERLKFSTSSVEPRHRVDLWRSTLADTTAPYGIKNYRVEDFHAEIAAVEVGGLKLAEITCSPQTYERPKSLIKSSHHDDYAVSFGSLGGGREAECPSIALIDLTRAHESPTMDSCVAIYVPRNRFERAFGLAQKAVGLNIGPDQASGPLIVGFLRGLMEHGHLLDPSTAERMASICLDLLAAGFAERLAHEPKVGMNATTLVYRAKTFIEDRLWDTRLDSAMIAAAINLSIRRLQEVFAEQKLTVDGYLWERRLARACLQLQAPAYDSTSIASIGYGVGFVSAAHFTRRFRQRFEMTPSEYRERARLDQVIGNGTAH